MAVSSPWVGSQTLNGTNPHAGPQPLNIAAAPDRVKTRSKFTASEKKTGVPTAQPMRAPIKPAKKVASPRKRTARA
jgi:hypothetical protein